MGAVVGSLLFGLLLVLTYMQHQRVKAWQVLFYLVISSVLAAVLTPSVNKVPPHRRQSHQLKVT